MQPISPLLQTKIQQSANNNQTTNIQYKDTSLQQDVVEISTKKKRNSKTALKIGAGVALATAATIAILKQRDLSKAKKDLTALYDVVFENARKNMPDSINFEKPKLVFKKLNKLTGGGYKPSENIINIDPRSLRSTSILRNLEEVRLFEPADGIEIADTCYKSSIFDMFKKGARNDFRMATREEALALEGSVMAHELMHAKQFQLLLSSEGGKEKYIQSIKAKLPNITNDELQKYYPFLFSYKPKKLMSESIRITEELPDGSTFKYGIQNLNDAFINYTSAHDNMYEYYTNLSEVSARNAECAYWYNVTNGILPKPKGVSDEFLKSMQTKTGYNAKVLMQATVDRAKGQA